MARVRLTVRNLQVSRHADAPDPQPEGVPFLSTDGALPLTRYLPWYRLLARVFVEPQDGEVVVGSPSFAAIIDTGAPLTCIPHHIWEPYTDHIR